MEKEYEELTTSATIKTRMDWARNEFIREYLRAFADIIIGKTY